MLAPDHQVRGVRASVGLPPDVGRPTTGLNGGMELERAEFESLVDRALDEIPDDLAALISNVVVLVEDDAPADDPDLLGLYDGVALTDREANYAAQLPDRIFLFRGPLLDLCDTVQQLEDEVRITVVHEVAHHFGIDDARLHDLGYA